MKTQAGKAGKRERLYGRSTFFEISSRVSFYHPKSKFFKLPRVPNFSFVFPFLAGNYNGNRAILAVNLENAANLVPNYFNRDY